jgi:hypothetical protein
MCCEYVVGRGQEAKGVGGKGSRRGGKGVVVTACGLCLSLVQAHASLVIEVCVQPSHSLTTFVFKKGRDIGVPGPKLAGGQTVAIENATAVIRIANDIVFYCQSS